MTLPPNFDGPRQLRPGELNESGRLDRLAFSFDPQEAAPPEPEDPADPRLDHTHAIFYNGQPVAQILIFHTPLRIENAVVQVGSIGGVGTHPDYRGQGLATRLLDHCAQQLVLGGARIMLISGGRGLYRRTGNVDGGRFAGFVLRPGSLARGRVPVRVRPAGPEDARLCAQIYEREPVRFERPIQRFSDFLQPRPRFYHAEQWIIELEGCPAAYLFLNVPWDQVRQPEPDRRGAHEYAGSRLALAGALGEIMAGGPIQELSLPAAWQDLDLIAALRDLGGQPGWTTLPDHTLRILNFPGLLADLRPYLAARLRPALLNSLRFEQQGPLLGHAGGDRLAVALGPHRLELDTATMTTLALCGPQSVPNLNLPGPLSEVIPAIFPLPSFLPGLDYH